MSNVAQTTLRILRNDKETLQQSKDGEYAYWQSRPPAERLAAMQELSLAFFEEPAMKLKLGADFCDLLSAFRAGDVKYLIIGGWAVSIHAQPRATQDLDIFVSSEQANIEAVHEALSRFGAPPCQVDIFPEIPGVEFEACWPNRVEVLLNKESALSANFISAQDLITTKIASGREQGIADAQAIKRALQQKGKSQ